MKQKRAPENADYVANIHSKVLDAATRLLKANGFILFEEVLRRADISLSNRRSIRWQQIRETLQQAFHQTLLGLSKQNIRDLMHSQFDEPLKVPLKEVRDEILKDRGSKLAGYSFPGRFKTAAQRQVIAREHVAAGFISSADRIRTDMGQMPLLSSESDE